MGVVHVAGTATGTCASSLLLWMMHVLIKFNHQAHPKPFYQIAIVNCPWGIPLPSKFHPLHVMGRNKAMRCADDSSALESAGIELV